MATDDIVASDGLPARRNGVWAKEKLSFIEEFGPPALKATERISQRYFVDLFAGPGKNIDPESREEFEGGALRALRMTAVNEARLYFTHAKLVNLDADHHAALRTRVARIHEKNELRTPLSHIEDLLADANQVVHRIMRSIHQRAYVFVFADTTAPRLLPWATIKALKQYEHRSVDLLMLFPLDMGLNRILPYAGDPPEPILDAFFGCDDWRRIYAERVTSAQSAMMRKRLLELYMNRMRDLGWRFVRPTRDIKRTGDVRLYNMIYATNHEAGDRIASWSARRQRGRNQIDFGL